MVDAKDAHFLARGSVKLGTFKSYAAIENGRADPNDGKSWVQVEEWSGEGPKDAAAFERATGFNLGPGRVVVRNSSFVEVPPPLLIFCMTEVGCDFDWEPDTAKAIFEVKDAFQLAEEIALELKGPLTWRIRKVVYRPPAATYSPGLAGPPVGVFGKALRFAPEREHRILFDLGPRRPVNEPICVESRRIRRLLRRVR